MILISSCISVFEELENVKYIYEVKQSKYECRVQEEWNIKKICINL